MLTKQNSGEDKLSKHISLYLPDQLVEWIDDRAKKENRSRNNFIEKALSDLEEGRLTPREIESAEIRKTRLPPSART